MCRTRLRILAATLYAVAAVQAQESGTKSNEAEQGKLVPGCYDEDLSPTLSPQDRERYCRWVVRFQKPGQFRHRRAELPKTADQAAVETALGNLRPAQPPQIENDRASVLIERKPGQFMVVSLARRDGEWQIVSMDDPATAHRVTAGKKTSKIR